MVPISYHDLELMLLDRASPFLGPGWLPEHLVRLNKAGSKKMEHVIPLCASIDTAKDKRDIAVHDSKFRLQVDNSGAGLATRLELIQSVPGIGERTALAILRRLPELGHVTREQAAALAGLAPFDQDSGRCRGQRHIVAGRVRLRSSLDAAALPAALHGNAALKALYGRLLARGKAHKAALIACARKLLIYANTVVSRGQS